MPLATDARYYVSLGDAQSRNLPGVVGAASAFCARLQTLEPGAKMVPLATDGATAGTVRYVQLPRLFAMNIAPSVLTLTLGATDLPRLAYGGADVVCRELAEHGGAGLGSLRATFPRCAVLLTTLYDPMDGTNAVLDDGVSRFNETIRALSDEHGCRIAEVGAAFAGHGASVGDPLTPNATPENTALFLCAGADLLPVPNERGAAVFANALWATYFAEGFTDDMPLVFDLTSGGLPL